MSHPALPERIATRADVERLLAAATNYEQRLPDAPQAFDLGRMEQLLDALGRPERGPRTVHVAGSKGKGSTVRLVDAALRAAGRGPVGLYTSPHLVDLAERIAVDGAAVDEPGLCRALERARPYVAATLGGPHAPTFFELLTAAAWLVFRERGCTEVVLETGLGGRLDATTVCRPAATAITVIEREHVRLLGDTVEQIAGEKAGILKPGVPAVTAASPPALGVIEARARALGAPLCVVGRDLRLLDVRTGPGARTRAVLEEDGRRTPIDLPVAGAHQALNAAVAFHLLRRLGLTPEAAADGMARVRLPAALEPFEGPPLVVLDGAHTVRSAEAALAGVTAAWPGRRLTLLLALMAEKEVDAILAVLGPAAAAVVATQVDSPRALPAEALAARLAPHCRGTVESAPAPAPALERALARTPPDGLLLVTGSLYLAGALRPALRARAPGPAAPGAGAGARPLR